MADLHQLGFRRATNVPALRTHVCIGRTAASVSVSVSSDAWVSVIAVLPRWTRRVSARTSEGARDSVGACASELEAGYQAQSATKSPQNDARAARAPDIGTEERGRGVARIRSIIGNSVGR